MSAVVNPDVLQSAPWGRWLYSLLGASSYGHFVVTFSLLIAGLYLFKGAYSYFTSRRLSYFKTNTQIALTDRLFRGYLYKPYLYHLHKSSSEILQSVSQDTQRMLSAVTSVVGITSESLVALFLLLFLLYISPWATLMAAVLIVGVLMLVNRVISKSILAAGQETRKEYVHMLKGVQQGLGGLKNTKTNRKERFFADAFKNHYANFSAASRKYTLMAQIPQIAVETVSLAGCFFIMAFLAWRQKDMLSLLPILGTFALAAVRLMPAANRINRQLTDLHYTRPYVEATCKALAETKEAWDSHRGQEEACRVQAEPLSKGVEVRHVTFAYPEQQKPLFTDKSLFIEAGKATALVGPTGAGKTTMADILLGLLQPNEGVVLADGKDIRTHALWWAGQLGYVPQSIYLSDTSLRENVAFGLDVDTIDDELVWNCLKEANIADFVASLPNGLGTKVGERGVRLSGGQRQRIGIARALYTNPSFIVLDEATSSLDTDTEQVIMDAIYHLAGKKTLLIIAHRLSTIQKCDKVYEITQ